MRRTTSPSRDHPGLALCSGRVRHTDRVLLKLDLEGHEVDALAGATTLLDRVEVLVTETQVYEIERNGRPVFADLIRILNERGFVLYDVAALASRPRDGRLRTGDVIFVPRGRALAGRQPMGLTPVRLTIVQTHPVQYNAPWFRHIAANCPELDLTVVYAARPRPEQQGAGFDVPFEWDTPLLDGYAWRLVREGNAMVTTSRPAVFGASTFRGIGAAVADTRPDIVLVPGWHSITCVRALLSARRRGVPVLYRGDTHRDGSVRLAASRLARQDASVPVALFRVPVGRVPCRVDYLESHGVAATRIYASPHAVDNDSVRRDRRAAPFRRRPRGGAGRLRRGTGRFHRAVCRERSKRASGRSMPCVLSRRSARTPCSPSRGGGDLEQAMRAEAERLGVRVTWLGFVNQSAMGARLRRRGLPRAAEWRESWGLVVNEAMATGLPAVAADRVGCAPDLIVPGETGEICGTGDVNDLGGGVAACARSWRARVHERGMPRAYRPPQLRCGDDRARGGVSVADVAPRAGAARCRLLRRAW